MDNRESVEEGEMKVKSGDLVSSSTGGQIGLVVGSPWTDEWGQTVAYVLWNKDPPPWKFYGRFGVVQTYRLFPLNNSPGIVGLKS